VFGEADRKRRGIELDGLRILERVHADVLDVHAADVERFVRYLIEDSLPFGITLGPPEPPSEPCGIIARRLSSYFPYQALPLGYDRGSTPLCD
jgi:hypothetical protein